MWIFRAILLLSLLPSSPPSVDLSAPATVGQGDVFEVVVSVYAAPQMLTLVATGGAVLDAATWQADAAPGFPQIHVWRVKAGDGARVELRAGGRVAFVNIRRPQVGACGQIGCYLQFAPWVGR